MNEPITLRQLFANRFFRIPDYQRGYAWGERQLDDLWQDLLDLQQNEDGSFRRHYTGTIYVERMSDAAISECERWARTNSSGFYYVVDGQQRLTTLWLLARYAVARLVDENQRKDLLKLLSRFSYADRMHATRFCQALFYYFFAVSQARYHSLATACL